MAGLNPALQALHTAIAEVALRANRLQELVQLGDLYRQLDGTYRALARGGKTTPVDWGQIEDVWFSFKNHDLQVLYGFVQNTRHIRQRVEMEIPAGVGTTVDEWIKQLDTLCGALQTVFDTQAQAKLSQAVTQLQTALMNQMAWHKGLVDKEVDQLCLLTELLRDRLK